MNPTRQLHRSSLTSLVGLALGAAAAAYSLRIWQQVEGLKRSLGRQRLHDDDLHDKKLGRYYYTFWPSYMQPEFEPPEVDQDGIPVSDYTRKLLIRGFTGRHYNPLTVAHWALGAYDDYLDTGDPRHYDLFIKRTDWLVENQQTIADGAVVWYHSAKVGKDQKPWASGMAQGFALSALCRAYQETGREEYKETARRALKGFSIPISAGGLAFTDEWGNLFFEVTIAPVQILNKQIIALFGLHDYVRITDDARAQELFRAGADALRNRLVDYDAGFWSRYSLNKRRTLFNHWTIAAPIYQQIHIDQLRILYNITGDQIFSHFANRWEAQQRFRPISEPINVAFVIFKDAVLISKRIRAVREDLFAKRRT